MARIIRYAPLRVEPMKRTTPKAESSPADRSERTEFKLKKRQDNAYFYRKHFFCPSCQKAYERGYGKQEPYYHDNMPSYGLARRICRMCKRLGKEVNHDETDR